MPQTQADALVIRRLLPNGLAGKDTYYYLKEDELGWTIDPTAARKFASRDEASKRLAQGVPDFVADAGQPEVAGQWDD